MTSGMPSMTETSSVPSSARASTLRSSPSSSETSKSSSPSETISSPTRFPCSAAGDWSVLNSSEGSGSSFSSSWSAPSRGTSSAHSTPVPSGPWAPGSTSGSPGSSSSMSVSTCSASTSAALSSGSSSSAAVGSSSSGSSRMGSSFGRSVMSDSNSLMISPSLVVRIGPSFLHVDRVRARSLPVEAVLPLLRVPVGQELLTSAAARGDEIEFGVPRETEIRAALAGGVDEDCPLGHRGVVDVSAVVCVDHRRQQRSGVSEGRGVGSPLRGGGVPGREHDPERRPPRGLGILAVEDVDGEIREQTAVGTEHGGASGRFRPRRQGSGAEEEGTGGRSAHRLGDGLAVGVDAEGVLIVPGQAQHPTSGDVGDDDDEPVGAFGWDR